jgi:hypothetical protein
MGSSGQKPRKKKSQQQHHRPQTSVESHEAHLHAEQQAVLDTMGVGNAPAWIKIVAVAIIVVFVLGGIAGLLLLTL